MISLLQLTLYSGWGELCRLRRKGATPPWLHALLFRGVVLGLFVIGFMLARLQIMKAQLPVFTV